VTDPEPETTFTSILESLLEPNMRVLEAGCGHGPDAARYASRVTC
jgi:cyclopropane fatty-acyl-phospholipid synthase-like methyltransferase